MAKQIKSKPLMEIFNRDGILNVLDILGDIESEARITLPKVNPDSYRDLTMILVRRHLEGRPTTVTTLAYGTSAPYTTALRRVEELIASGLVIKRPRTQTGKSFSLHPSPALVEAWYKYARRVEQIIRIVAGKSQSLEAAERVEDTAAPSFAKTLLPAPPVLDRPLDLVPPLRVLVHYDPTFVAMDGLKRQFEQILGVAVHIRAVSIDRLHEIAISHADDAVAPFDLMACDLPWVGEYAEKGILTALDDFVASMGVDVFDFHTTGWNACKHGGRHYGIPILTTPELLFYRQDIFAEYDLEAPVTTDQLLQAAGRLHRPAIGLRGIAWNAARGTALGHTFLFAMAAFGQPVVDLRAIEGGFSVEDLDGARRRPMVATPEGRAAAGFLRRLVDFSPHNILSMGWQERAAAYARGEVAMAFSYTLLAPKVEFDKRSPAHARTGFLPYPHGPGARNIAPLGGFVLGVPRNIAKERRSAALRALRTITSAEACKAYILNGSLVSPRFSVGADPDVRRLSSVIPIVDDMARTGLQQHWPRPPVAEIADIITICGEEIHDALRDVKTTVAATDLAQKRIDALMRANGRY